MAELAVRANPVRRLQVFHKLLFSCVNSSVVAWEMVNSEQKVEGRGPVLSWVVALVVSRWQKGFGGDFSMLWGRFSEGVDRKQ